MQIQVIQKIRADWRLGLAVTQPDTLRQASHYYQNRIYCVDQRSLMSTPDSGSAIGEEFGRIIVD